MGDAINDIARAVENNPVLSGLIATAFGAVASFLRPLAIAARTALIRRIDQAWSEDVGEESTREERVIAEVKKKTLAPGTLVDEAARQRRSRDR